MKTQTIIALKFLLVMTILTGIFYPLLMTGIAQLSYPSKADGSLIMKDGKIVGSELIGQKFDSSIYFWSRPSAIGYNPIPSGASNYGPTSDTLKKLVTSRRDLFAKMNSIANVLVIPKEMLFASGSGLDPHISPEAALMQIDRVVKSRHFDNSQKEKLLLKIKDLTEPPQYLFLGEKRINVLILNLELDKIGNLTSNQ
ncbi:MAG: potassium-transporting ATPase subunit KdpC [Bacteroidales bacterium]|jgi:potassium-transporting ATPase KdpC subunit